MKQEFHNAAAQTVELPRLYDKYVQVTANTYAPDYPLAKRLLVDMMCRCARAHQLLELEEHRRATAVDA